jgi:hypothetical protein
MPIDEPMVDPKGHFQPPGNCVPSAKLDVDVGIYRPTAFNVLICHAIAAVPASGEQFVLDGPNFASRAELCSCRAKSVLERAEDGHEAQRIRVCSIH